MSIEDMQIITVDPAMVDALSGRLTNLEMEMCDQLSTRITLNDVSEQVSIVREEIAEVCSSYEKKIDYLQHQIDVLSKLFQKFLCVSEDFNVEELI